MSLDPNIQAVIAGESDGCIVCADSFDIMADMPDRCVGAGVTDPPYGVDVADWDSDVPYHAIPLLLRVAVGPVVWFGSAPRAIIDAKSFPVEPDRLMIWSPRFTLSKIAKDGFAYRFHPIWWWRVAKQKIIPWDILNDSCDGRNWWYHPGTKPLKLMEKIVNSTGGNLILDPFCGSGTTCVAAKKLGRRYIGIDISEKYCKIAEKRLVNTPKPVKIEDIDKPGIGKAAFF